MLHGCRVSAAWVQLLLTCNHYATGRALTIWHSADSRFTDRLMRDTFSVDIGHTFDRTRSLCVDYWIRFNWTAKKHQATMCC